MSWTPLSKGTTNELSSVFFPSASTGYAVGIASVFVPSVIVKTTDGGTNWTLLSNGPEDTWLSSVFFTDVSTGYVVDLEGHIYKTTSMEAQVGIHYPVERPWN